MTCSSGFAGAVVLHVAFNACTTSAVRLTCASFDLCASKLQFERSDVRCLVCVARLMAAEAALCAAWQFNLTTSERDLTFSGWLCTEIFKAEPVKNVRALVVALEIRSVLTVARRVYSRAKDR